MLKLSYGRSIVLKSGESILDTVDFRLEPGRIEEKIRE
jgi:hypothetical protein